LEPFQKALKNEAANKYFEAVENVTICNGMQAWRKNQRFYLTQDDHALSLPKAENEIKIIDKLILSGIGYNALHLFQTITTVIRQTHEKIWKIY
jgi:hypothetical protein